jgi:WD40 repeat protein
MNTIVLGSRDGSLYLYNNNGVLINRYENIHKAAVCTLSLVVEEKFLVSGSDHPHPEIIVWEIVGDRLQVYCKFNEHKGAVTAVQCLRDS